LSEFLEGEDPSELTKSTPLISTGILDSMATLKLVLFLESEFSISIDPQEVTAEYLDTIEKMAGLVQSKST
jgi:acyl carrier protein